jgi:hypothetical protein
LQAIGDAWRRFEVQQTRTTRVFACLSAGAGRDADVLALASPDQADDAVVEGDGGVAVIDAQTINGNGALVDEAERFGVGLGESDGYEQRGEASTAVGVVAERGFREIDMNEWHVIGRGVLAEEAVEMRLGGGCGVVAMKK